MFDIGFWELCVIGVVLLLVLGPERMPEVARQIGYWVGRARRTVNSLKAEMKRELDAIPTSEITKAAKLANEGLGDIKSEMTELNKGLKEKVGGIASEIEDVANTRLDQESATESTAAKPAASVEVAEEVAGSGGGTPTEESTGDAPPNKKDQDSS